MGVPYTFGTATTSIPLSQLDANFNTTATLGNAAIGLGNTTTTVGNLTLTNVTISSGNVTISNVSASSITDSGNLTFTGTGNRIIGDFSNSTIANRVAFQTSTANSVTVVSAIPSGTATQSNFNVFNNSDPTNSANGRFIANATEIQIQSTVSGTGTYLPMTFCTGGSERMRIDTSGNVGIGTSSPANRLDIVQSQNGSSFVYLTNANSGASSRAGFSANSDTVQTNLYATASGYTGVASWQGAGVLSVGSGSTNGLIFNCEGQPIKFQISRTEAMRITSGVVLMGKTTTGVATNGFEYEGSNGGLLITRGGNPPFIVNRNTDDGTLVEFRQDNATEGSISVSGNTVSYNAFAGSHWSQLSDGSKPEILRGTVLESINELVEWPNEPTSERLCRVKVSDTASSKKVYGVFMDWDNDWTLTNDMLVTSVGAFICRINKDVVVEEGDLLESNGDGTARVQTDDIMRSSTIGKVTCTVKTHQYADGSYCVPTVLYCG